MFNSITWRKTPKAAVEETKMVVPVRKKPVVIPTCDGHVDALWIQFKRRILNRDAPPPLQIRSMKSGGLDSAVFALYLHDKTMEGKTQDEIDLLIDWQVNVWRDEYCKISENKQYLGLEGGHLLGGSLQRLTELALLKLSVLTLTHNFNNTLATSSTDKNNDKGLTEFGQRVCRYCEESGIVVDVSHASDATVTDVLETIFVPIIASHSGCRHLNPHVRNLSDDLIKEIADTKGVIGVPFAKRFIAPYQPVDHIDHIVSLTGSPNYVAIGSDLDGAEMIDKCPDVSHWKEVTGEALYRKGFREHEIKAICGGNLIRVLEGNIS